MTPSQQAKEFARANGFSIEPVGRRYTVRRTMSPQCLHVVGEVGGYPAALNAMRKWLDDMQASDTAAFNNPNDAKLAHCDVVRDDGAMGVFADAPVTVVDVAAGPDRTVVGTVVLPSGNEFSGLRNQVLGRAPRRSVGISFEVNPRDVVDGQIVRGVAHRNEGGPVVESRAFEGVTWGTLEPITPDTVPMPREEMFAPVKAELDRLRTFYPPVAFDDFDAAGKARIRKMARKASGKPPGGPWHVIFDGRQLTKPGYPSRAAALAVVRWGFNHTDARIRNNWRTATLNVEFRK